MSRELDAKLKELRAELELATRSCVSLLEVAQAKVRELSERLTRGV